MAPLGSAFAVRTWCATLVAETNYNNDGLNDETINPWVFLKTLLVFTYDICLCFRIQSRLRRLRIEPRRKVFERAEVYFR